MYQCLLLVYHTTIFAWICEGIFIYICRKVLLVVQLHLMYFKVLYPLNLKLVLFALSVAIAGAMPTTEAPRQHLKRYANK